MTTKVKKVLFVCSRNRLRSPTAEYVFCGRANLEVASAGLNKDADVRLSSEMVEWADVIFVMEQTHRTKLAKWFKSHLKTTRLVCLDIPDKYEYMQPELVELLEQKVGRLLKI